MASRKAPPKRIRVKGHTYVLAAPPKGNQKVKPDPDDIPEDLLEEPADKSVKIPVADVVQFWNEFPIIKTLDDQYASLFGVVERAMKEAMWQKNGGLKLIVDSGYDKNLAERVEDDPKFFYDVLSQFVEEFTQAFAAVELLHEAFKNIATQASVQKIANRTQLGKDKNAWKEKLNSQYGLIRKEGSFTSQLALKRAALAVKSLIPPGKFKRIMKMAGLA